MTIGIMSADRVTGFATAEQAKSSILAMILRQAVVLLGLLGAGLGKGASDLQTVSFLDLDRYAGKWYEIARYPNWFEASCISDVTAEYLLLGDNKVKVVNSCTKADGRRKVSTGSAKVVDKQSNAKLKVTFFWPFYGDYWVIDLDPEYRYAVVSEPTRKYLWILSRTPQMDTETYGQVIGRLRARGYDPAKLIRPKQE